MFWKIKELNVESLIEDIEMLREGFVVGVNCNLELNIGVFNSLFCGFILFDCYLK